MSKSFPLAGLSSSRGTYDYLNHPSVLLPPLPSVSFPIDLISSARGVSNAVGIFLVLLDVLVHFTVRGRTPLYLYRCLNLFVRELILLVVLHIQTRNHSRKKIALKREATKPSTVEI